MLPQVSVCIFSFNYEKYISEAIESVLDQDASFPYEIVIGDDCSTDKTREIATAYRNKYPDKIRLSFNETNLGGTRNWIRTMNQCKGRYIALIDGDDYFIDRRKLQKQFDALEGDRQANLCFHSVREIFENRNNLSVDVTFPKTEYLTADILKQGWFIRTSSLFFRNGILPGDPPAWVYDFPYRYDTILITILSLHSKAINCKDVMTVWRRHDAGLSYAITRNSLENYQKERRLYEHLKVLSANRHNSSVNSYIRKVRTGVVYVALKTLKVQNLAKLGLSIFNIDYKYLLQLSTSALKNRFGKSNG